MTTLEVAQLFRVPVANVKRQYAANAAQLQSMADKARSLDKIYRGQSAAYWQAKADEYARRAK